MPADESLEDISSDSDAGYTVNNTAVEVPASVSDITVEAPLPLVAPILINATDDSNDLYLFVNRITGFKFEVEIARMDMLLLSMPLAQSFLVLSWGPSTLHFSPIQPSPLLSATLLFVFLLMSELLLLAVKCLTLAL